MSVRLSGVRPSTTFMPAPAALLQRKCACEGSDHDCEECRKKGTLQRKAADGGGPEQAPSIVHEVLRTHGQPLDPPTRGFMEARFGHDFSRVRVHTDAKSSESARAVNALAYTVGHQVVFGVDQYAPQSIRGQKLIAHELAHTIQQGDHFSEPEVSRANEADDAAEIEADRASEEALSRRAVTVEPDSPKVLARQVDPDLKKQIKDLTRGPQGPSPTITGGPEAGSSRDVEAAPQVRQGQPGTGQAGEAAPPVGQSQPGQAAGSSPSFTLPICTSTPANNWISDPQQRGGELFGLTTLVGAGGTAPEFKVEPAPGGKGVKVKETYAALQPITLQHLAAGSYPDRKPYTFSCDLSVDHYCGWDQQIRPRVIWDVTADGSARLAEAEQEHCIDYQYAFYFSLGRIAELVNELARSGRRFPNEASAKAELQKSVKLDPKDWVAYFACLAQASKDARDTGQHPWHTPLSPLDKKVRGQSRWEAGTGGQPVMRAPIILPQVKTGDSWLHNPWDVLQGPLATCNARIPATP